eukprot:9471228-Pyramimonas_sp.AAC.1
MCGAIYVVQYLSCNLCGAFNVAQSLARGRGRDGAATASLGPPDKQPGPDDGRRRGREGAAT